MQNLLASIGPRRHLAAVVESHSEGVALGVGARDGIAADSQGSSVGRASGPGWARGQGKLLIGDIVASLRPCAVLLDAQFDIDEIFARLVGHGLQRQGDACRGSRRDRVEVADGSLLHQPSILEHAEGEVVAVGRNGGEDILVGEGD